MSCNVQPFVLLFHLHRWWSVWLKEGNCNGFKTGNCKSLIFSLAQVDDDGDGCFDHTDERWFRLDSKKTMSVLSTQSCVEKKTFRFNLLYSVGGQLKFISLEHDWTKANFWLKCRTIFITTFACLHKNHLCFS